MLFENIFENIAISLVLIGCLAYLIQKLWPQVNRKKSNQSAGCSSCVSECHTPPKP